tara:strand:+ start:115 stop:294 length:180 start_codon:yes stop_codon:yes gene_type:complete
MKGLKLIKVTSMVGAFMFALGMLMSNSTSVVADGGDTVGTPGCNGSGIQCVSHLPERLP